MDRMLGRVWGRLVVSFFFFDLHTVPKIYPQMFGNRVNFHPSVCCLVFLRHFPWTSLVTRTHTGERLILEVLWVSKMVGDKYEDAKVRGPRRKRKAEAIKDGEGKLHLHWIGQILYFFGGWLFGAMKAYMTWFSDQCLV